MAATTPWSRWLRKELREREWKDAELVRRADGRFGSSEVSRWLAGKVTPKLDSIRTVCDVLGVPAVQGMIAAGHLEAADVGATIVELPPLQTEQLSNADLLDEIGRRLEQALRPSNEDSYPNGEAEGVVTASTENVTTGRFQAPTYGQEGEDFAARRPKHPRGQPPA